MAEEVDLLRCLADTRLLLLDVDGVLTDGRIIYHDDGSEIKMFHVRDGLGIRLLMAADVQVGIVTGRSSGALHRRCENLGIALVFDGVGDKAAVLSSIEEKTGIPAGRTAFMGDDLPDIPLMRRVGLSIAVADAHPRVRETAQMVTRLPGGAGAVREVCEAMLDAQGVLSEMIRERFPDG